MALDRDDVVAGAIRLLDEVGLDGLTLRRLAGDLGVSAPTLYWHVRDKRALLDLMATRMAGEPPPTCPADGQPWEEWLSEAAWSQYRALVAHRDGARVVAGNRPPVDALSAIDAVIGSLVEVGFPPDEAFETILTLGQFAVGSALEYQAEAARADVPDRDTALATRLREADDLPHLTAAAVGRTAPDPDRTFGHGLGLLMAGLSARHAELTGAPRSP